MAFVFVTVTLMMAAATPLAGTLPRPVTWMLRTLPVPREPPPVRLS